MKTASSSEIASSAGVSFREANVATLTLPEDAISQEVPKKKPEGESSHELKALHGLRFFAAFCILFSHACTWLANFKDNSIIQWIGEFFTVYGMPLFFVLSGFVIHYNYSKLFSTKRPAWAIFEFIGARFARIYPLFICFLLVGIAVDGVLQWAYEHKFNLLLFFTHFLSLTQSWVYVVIFGDRQVLDNGYGLSWSLSTEFFFYFTYLVLVLHLNRFRKSSVLYLLAGAMSAMVIVAFILGARHQLSIKAFAGRYMNDHFEQWDHSAFRWFFYYSPYSRVFEFILGCLTAQIYLLRSQQPVSPNEARIGNFVLIASLVYLGSFGLAYVFKPFGPRYQEYFELLKLNYGCAIPIAAMVFCVSRYRSSAFAALISTPLMVLLGDLSYSIYTVHTWTLRIFERPETNFRIGLGIEAVIRIVLAVALTLILSVATYRLIEVPARAWLRKLVWRRLVRHFGPAAANAVADGNSLSKSAAVALGMSFVAVLAMLLAYQFLIVPHFTPYTR